MAKFSTQRLLIILLLLPVIGIIAYSCKKYPDGPSVSIFSRVERVFGKYDIVSYTVDGADSLSLLNNKFDTIIYGFDAGTTAADTNFYEIDYGSGKKYYSFWKLNNGDKNLCCGGLNYRGDPSHQIGPLAAPIELCFEVLRLTRNDLWLQKQYHGKTYVIKMKDRGI